MKKDLIKPEQVKTYLSPVEQAIAKAHGGTSTILSKYIRELAIDEEKIALLIESKENLILKTKNEIKDLVMLMAVYKKDREEKLKQEKEEALFIKKGQAHLIEKESIKKAHSIDEYEKTWRPYHTIRRLLGVITETDYLVVAKSKLLKERFPTYESYLIWASDTTILTPDILKYYKIHIKSAIESGKSSPQAISNLLVILNLTSNDFTEWLVTK